MAPMGKAYGHAIEWSQAIRRADMDEILRPTTDLLSHLADDILGSIEAYGPKITSDIKTALSNLDERPSDAEPLLVTMQLTLTMSEDLVERLSEAMEELRLQL